MEILFRIHHLSEIVNGSQGIPEEKNSNGAVILHLIFSDKRTGLFLGIQATVGLPMFSLVMGHTTTAKCWKTLAIHLSPRKTSHSQSIRDQLDNLKKLNSKTMGEFIIKV